MGKKKTTKKTNTLCYYLEQNSKVIFICEQDITRGKFREFKGRVKDVSKCLKMFF